MMMQGMTGLIGFSGGLAAAVMIRNSARVCSSAEAFSDWREKIRICAGPFWGMLFLGGILLGLGTIFSGVRTLFFGAGLGCLWGALSAGGLGENHSGGDILSILLETPGIRTRAQKMICSSQERMMSLNKNSINGYATWMVVLLILLDRLKLLLGIMCLLGVLLVEGGIAG